MATSELFCLLLLPVSCFSLFYPYPFHASCKIEWNFSVDCAGVQNRIAIILERWSGPEGCQTGGEKCLYTLVSRTPEEIKATHETPVKHYKDDLTFKFINKTEGGCTVKGYSRSEKWYALLDQGTNYCNLHNIIIAADLFLDPAYRETTGDSQCTQFSKADCDKY